MARATISIEVPGGWLGAFEFGLGSISSDGTDVWVTNSNAIANSTSTLDSSDQSITAFPA